MTRASAITGRGKHMGLNDQETRLMQLELQLLLANLRTQQEQTKVHVYESILTQLPGIVFALGMGDEAQRERATQLLATLAEALETFWREIGEEHGKETEEKEDDLGDDFGDDDL